jgi:antitoxin (DNA-binding transcriptional repressor) of toxin-antitoxin stability system
MVDLDYIHANKTIARIAPVSGQHEYRQQGATARISPTVGENLFDRFFADLRLLQN